MKIRTTFIPSLALALSFGASLLAQGVTTEPGDLTFSFKPSYGTTMGNVKTDLKMDQSLGFGIEGRYALTSSSWVIGQLTYTYYPGKIFDNTNYTGPIYVGTPGNAVSVNTLGNPYYLDTPHSVDARKNHMAGFSLRGGYSAQFATDWAWQAGLTLDLLQYTQEVSGYLDPYSVDLIPATNTVPAHNGPTANAVGYEGLSVTPHKASLGIGAFAGVKYTITENFTLDFNAVSMGYTTQNYRPFTYTGQAPSVETQTRHGFGLEVAFGLKL